MSCSGRNLLVNGGFAGLAPWKGKKIRLVPNPVKRKDTSVRIGKRGFLYQNVSGSFEHQCAYYLYFRIFNKHSSPPQPQLYAVVSWLDEGKRLLRSTPLLVEPAHPAEPRFTSYFTIVPPPPVGTRILSVVFLVKKAPLLVDYISVLSKDVLPST
ncbi:hypothetical protein [Salinithrix halophila]|uniref:hypothetical protein n=1 Tax=Salinithrix halophila TaxID=1485204 RepID=UPI0036D33A81